MSDKVATFLINIKVTVNGWNLFKSEERPEILSGSFLHLLCFFGAHFDFKRLTDPEKG